MRVRIHDARDDVQAIRVDLPRSGFVDTAHGHDAAIANRNICAAPWETGAVDHDSIADDEIVQLVEPPVGRYFCVVEVDFVLEPSACSPQLSRDRRRRISAG